MVDAVALNKLQMRSAYFFGAVFLSCLGFFFSRFGVVLPFAIVNLQYEPTA